MAGYVRNKRLLWAPDLGGLCEGPPVLMNTVPAGSLADGRLLTLGMLLFSVPHTASPGAGSWINRFPQPLSVWTQVGLCLALTLGIPIAVKTATPSISRKHRCELGLCLVSVRVVRQRAWDVSQRSSSGPSED